MNKEIRVAIVTESKEGSASIIIPEIYKFCKENIIGLIYCESLPQKSKNHYLRKVRKTLKIGFFGALLGVYLRKWYRQDLKKYVDIKPIKTICEDLSIPYYKSVGLNSLKTKEKLASLNVDLAISLGCSYISSKVFNIPKNGMINIHHELLPEYQNAQSIIWQLYNNSRKTGYTIHKITKKIDDGPILFKKERKISIKDSLGETVSFNYANSILDSSNGLVKVIEFLNKGEFENKSIPQSGLKRSYTTPSLLSFIKIYRNWKKMSK